MNDNNYDQFDLILKRETSKRCPKFVFLLFQRKIFFLGNCKNSKVQSLEFKRVLKR